ncbi:hypothetical protein GQ457_15G018870 [Hibiscus cannabinus]
MVTNSEAIKTLQEVSTQHVQVLQSLQAHVVDHKAFNAQTQQTLQDISCQLAEISSSLGQSSHANTNNELRILRGKAKVNDEALDAFPFPPKPIYVELPLFIGKDPEERLASAQDFLISMAQRSYRITMASFHMDGTAKKMVSLDAMTVGYDKEKQRTETIN